MASPASAPTTDLRAGTCGAPDAIFLVLRVRNTCEARVMRHTLIDSEYGILMMPCQHSTCPAHSSHGLDLCPPELRMLNEPEAFPVAHMSLHDGQGDKCSVSGLPSGPNLLKHCMMDMQLMGDFMI